MLVSNNFLLSKTSLLMNSGGAAFVHNIFAGKIDVVSYDARLTPYHKPHSTYVIALHDNPGGDAQFVNNLFVNGGDASQYSKALLQVVFDGNVYTKGSVRATKSSEQKKFGEMNEKATEQMKNYKEQNATEQNALIKDDFDASVNLLKQGDEMYLEIALDKDWHTQKRILVTTETLRQVIIPNLPFKNVDGSPLKIDVDYFGNKRNMDNPSPGPFEISQSGKQTIKVWPVNK
jgi:alpha-N-arabinofuranosidase